MLSQDTTPTLHEAALLEMQEMLLNTYTPMSREEWERNQAIVDEVFGKLLPLKA